MTTTPVLALDVATYLADHGVNFESIPEDTGAESAVLGYKEVASSAVAYTSEVDLWIRVYKSVDARRRGTEDLARAMASGGFANRFVECGVVVVEVGFAGEQTPERVAAIASTADTITPLLADSVGPC